MIFPFNTGVSCIVVNPPGLTLPYFPFVVNTYNKPDCWDSLAVQAGPGWKSTTGLKPLFRTVKCIYIVYVVREYDILSNIEY